MKGIYRRRCAFVAIFCWGIVHGAMLPGGQVLAAEKPPSEEMTLRVFRLMHRDPKSMEEMVRPFLSPQGLILSDSRTHSLVVKDRPDNLKQIEQLLQLYDQPGRAFLVRVEFQGRGTGRESGMAVEGRVRVGDVEVESGRRAGQPSGARISLGAGRSDVSQHQAFSLRLMEGVPGSIYSGRVIPHATWFLHYAWDHGYLVRGVVFQEARSGFSVTAYLRGEDRVELEVMPQLQIVVDERRKILSLTEAATRLVTRVGRPVVLGEIEEDHLALYDRIFEGFAQEEKHRNVAIVLTPMLIE